MRSFILSILSLVSVSAFAGDTGCAKPQSCCQPSPPKPPQNCCPCDIRNQICVYETYDTDGINIGVRGDVLYMIYQVPVLTYGSRRSTTGGIVSSTILNVPGHLSLGCNLALTYTLPNKSGYTLESGWYHIVAKFSRSVTAADILPAHSVVLTLPAPGTASVNAHMAINFFDFLLKKDFAFGNWFSMTPAVGLVGGYMNGKNTANFDATTGGFSAAVGGGTATTVASLSYTTKFEGIGIKLGGCSSFKLWRGLKLQAELFYNALYGFAKDRLDYAQNGVSVVPAIGAVTGSTINYRQHHGRTFFDALVGLAWGRGFCNNSYYADLHAGWRFQTFSDGWKEFEAELNDSLHELSLSGQGLQAGATFKF